MSDITAALQAARSWTPESGEEMNTTGKIRHRLFQGEALHAEEVASTYHVSNGMLGTTAKNLKSLGYTFDESSIDGKKHWRLTNPEHMPTPEQIEHMRQVNQEARDRKAKSAAKPKKAPKQTKVVEPETVPMPVFGDFVEVYSMHANGDGQVTIGLRDNETAWQVVLVAGAPR